MQNSSFFYFKIMSKDDKITLLIATLGLIFGIICLIESLSRAEIL